MHDDIFMSHRQTIQLFAGSVTFTSDDMYNFLLWLIIPVSSKLIASDIFPTECIIIIQVLSQTSQSKFVSVPFGGVVHA